MSENPYLPPVEVNGASQNQRGSRFWSIAAPLVALGAIGGLLGLYFLPLIHRPYYVGRLHSCENKLRQIQIALHSYHDQYRCLPPAYTVDAEGKPLHSWRTLLLPYLEQKELYDSIDLTKPWNHPVNQQAFQKSVSVYQCGVGKNLTTYQVIQSPQGCFYQATCRSFSKVTDPQNETVLVIEVPTDQAVPWMAPYDTDEERFLAIGPDSKLSHGDCLEVVFCDGLVRTFRTDCSSALRRRLITISAEDNPSDR